MCSDGEERGCEHGQGDVSVPGVVLADLVVVQAGLVLGELEGFLDAPTTSGDADELGHGHWLTAVADVVGQLAGLGDRAPHEEQVVLGAGVDE